MFNCHLDQPSLHHGGGAEKRFQIISTPRNRHAMTGPYNDRLRQLGPTHCASTCNSVSRLNGRLEYEALPVTAGLQVAVNSLHKDMSQ